MSDLFNLLDQMYGGGEAQSPAATSNGINSLYDKLIDAQKELSMQEKLQEESDRLRGRLAKPRNEYRDERMADWMPKSKMGKVGLGIVEFLSGLGGKPGMIGQQRALINQDYDNQQENDRAALQLYKADAGIFNDAQKRQISLAKAKVEGLLKDNKLDLDKAQLDALKSFRNAQIGIANKKLDQQEEFNQLASMYKLAQIKAIQDKKQLGGFAGFLDKMKQDGHFTDAQVKDFAQKYAAKMSSITPQFDTIIESNPAGTVKRVKKGVRGAFDKVDLTKDTNN